MRLGSTQYPEEYFKRTACRLIVRMPQCFVQNGALTWTAVLSHLELWAEIEWKERHGLDFCGQKTMNANDPALTTEPTNANRTLAYLYTGELHNVTTCKAYKNNEPAPRKVADGEGESAPSNVTTKEQAQQACVTKYKSIYEYFVPTWKPSKKKRKRVTLRDIL